MLVAMSRGRVQLTRYITPIFFFLGGCAATADRPKLIELMWPEPPLAPRIKFVRTLASELDLRRTPTFREILLETITGKKPNVSC